MQTLSLTASEARLLVPSPTRQPPKLIALGDSLVYGYGDMEGGGWIERLRRQWMAAGPESPVLYNLGVRGDGVVQVSQRLEVEFACRGELRNKLPDGIILSVGMNDCPRLGKPEGRNMLHPDRFAATIGHLLEQAQRLAPVWFVGMTPIAEAKMPFLDCLWYCQEEQFRYKEITRLACEARKIPYLDLFEQWLDRGDNWWQARLSEDGLHPNSLGYSAILDDVLAWQDGFYGQPKLSLVAT